MDPARPGPPTRRPPSPLRQAGGMSAPSASLPLLRGHRGTRLGRSPFADVRVAAVAAALWGTAAAVWVLTGDALPGGRWFAVHLVTLGLLSNAIVGFTQHFGITLTRASDEHAMGLGWTALLNAGALGVLVGLPAGLPWLLATGATALTAGVLRSWWGLRTLRKEAVGARFAWIVRIYERAHGGFLHGALLGALLGIGVLPGSWHASARLAHLHVMVLGWAGLTLLSTIVFFGPTMVRGRIRPGADDRAARWLRDAATAISVATIALLLTGLGGHGGTAARLIAATWLAVYAAAATVVAWPVLLVAVGAKRSALRGPVAAAAAWLPLVVWADVAVVATGAWRFHDAVGVAGLVGVLVQIVAAALAYVTPMLRGRTFAARDRILARLERLAAVRTALLNAGVVAIVVAAVGRWGGDLGATIARSGWAAAAVALAATALAALWPVRVDPDAPAASAVARRYRS